MRVCVRLCKSCVRMSVQSGTGSLCSRARPVVASRLPSR